MQDLKDLINSGDYPYGMSGREDYLTGEDEDYQRIEHRRMLARIERRWAELAESHAARRAAQQ